MSYLKIIIKMESSHQKNGFFKSSSISMLNLDYSWIFAMILPCSAERPAIEQARRTFKWRRTIPKVRPTAMHDKWLVQRIATAKMSSSTPTAGLRKPARSVRPERMMLGVHLGWCDDCWLDCFLPTSCGSLIGQNRRGPLPRQFHFKCSSPEKGRNLT